MARLARVLVDVTLEYRIPIDDEVLDVNVEAHVRQLNDDGTLLDDVEPVGVYSGPDVDEVELLPQDGVR